MPLIGAGRSRTAISESDILEFLVKLIKINKDLITFDLHIVVRYDGNDSVRMTNL